MSSFLRPVAGFTGLNWVWSRERFVKEENQHKTVKKGLIPAKAEIKAAYRRLE